MRKRRRNKQESKILFKNKKNNEINDDESDNYTNMSRASDVIEFDNLIINSKQKQKYKNLSNPIFAGIKLKDSDKFIKKNKLKPYVEQSSNKHADYNEKEVLNTIYVIN